jgi:ubiquinone/menaquinone biosynthesis C-methylase UbiE
VSRDHESVQKEFERVASSFAERTQGRFDHMQVVEFSRVRDGESVMEVGAGTGNFLALFSEVAGSLVALDVTPGMLREAVNRHTGITAVVGDGARVPVRSGSVDLVASAQMFHHVADPAPIIGEMGRVARGRVLVVDQVSAENQYEADAMTELELIRDPTHALTRTPSDLRRHLPEAGLEIIDERIAVSRDRFSKWMWPQEFPEDRIRAVRRFIEERGGETGMEFEPDGDDFIFTRHRLMLLAQP